MNGNKFDYSIESGSGVHKPQHVYVLCNRSVSVYYGGNSIGCCKIKFLHMYCVLISQSNYANLCQFQPINL